MIIREACQLFIENGIENVSVVEIADKSGVSEKSIYRYFGNKTNLLLQTTLLLWKEIIGELLPSMDESYRDKNGFHQMELLLKRFKTLLKSHADHILFVNNYELYLARQGEKLVAADVYDEIIDPLKLIYMEALDRGIHDGSIAARQETESLFWPIWGLMRGYAVKIVIYDRVYLGENCWLKSLDVTISMILSSLKKGFN